MSKNDVTQAADAQHEIEFTLNGEDVSTTVAPSTTLVELLRDRLNRTGTTQGCGVGICGSCTVLVDGEVIASCLELAMNIDGSEVLTVEGLADRHEGDGLHPLQESFQDHEGFQCAYCTPGMLISSYAMLQEEPDPDEDDIVTHLSENICRCTGYESIIEAVSEATEQ